MCWVGGAGPDVHPLFSPQTINPLRVFSTPGDILGRTSRIPGFYNLSPEERLRVVAEFADLTDEEKNALLGKTFGIEDANRMIENVVGIWPLPLGIATNFVVNGRDVLVPMAIEEPSVVAAASNAAKIARIKGGFKAEVSGSEMIGQVQLVDVPDPEMAVEKIRGAEKELLSLANSKDPVLVKFGGGARRIEVRTVDTSAGKMVVVHLVVDVKDAMGANAVNTMAETIAHRLEDLSGGRALLRIISNLAVYRVARAKAVFDKDALGGEKVVDAIIKAFALADADPYRCATHNKGIMNGVSAVVRATGNDTRAVEAGAHAYAARDGRYRSLTRYYKNEDGDLVGEIELPVAVGVVGGATRAHPVARACIKILGVKTAPELGEILAAVGLAQNLAALRALVTEGIQRGHMRLHARNIAAQAGAVGDEIDVVARKMVEQGEIREDVARELLAEIRGKTGSSTS